MRWSVAEIEGLTDDEYDALPTVEKLAIAQVLLDDLVSDGLAYQGEDGRYRLREDVRRVSPDTFTKAKPH